MGIKRCFGTRVTTIALLAGAHFVVTLACFLLGFGDWGDLAAEPTTFERVAWGAATVLSAPGRWLWTSWASRNLPDVVEWALVLANSLLWGAAGAALWNAWRRRRRAGS